MSNDDKTEIAEVFIYGLRARDWRALRFIMTEDVIWTLPGTSLISGAANGIDAVVERAQQIVDGGITFALKHILIGEHGVTLSLHNTAQKGELIFDEHLATVCMMRDDKIYAINTYLSDVKMLNAYFA